MQQFCVIYYIGSYIRAIPHIFELIKTKSTITYFGGCINFKVL